MRSAHLAAPASATAQARSQQPRRAGADAGSLDPHRRASWRAAAEPWRTHWWSTSPEAMRGATRHRTAESSPSAERASPPRHGGWALVSELRGNAATVGTAGSQFCHAAAAASEGRVEGSRQSSHSVLARIQRIIAHLPQACAAEFHRRGLLPKQGQRRRKVGVSQRARWTVRDLA